MSLRKISYIGRNYIPIGFPVYYDTESGKYKVRFKCMKCGDDVGCMCYDTLLDAAYNEDVLLCSKRRCFVSVNLDTIVNESEISCMIPCIPLNECTQNEINDLYNEYVDNVENQYDCMQVLSRLKLADELSDEEVNELYDILLDFDFDDCIEMTGKSC